MPTLQNKVLVSFKHLLNESDDILDQEIIENILNIIIELAVKEDRGENVDANVNAQTNNIVELFE